MSWLGGSKKASPMEEDASKGAARGQSAMPPPCPRCELTKSQVRMGLGSHALHAFYALELNCAAPL